MSFTHAPARLSIGSLDDASITLEAQYNPTELELSKTVPYGDDEGLAMTPTADSTRSATANTAPKKEFTGAKGRDVKLELFFDGYEDGRSIEPMIDMLDRLSSSRDATSPREDMRRPHHCVVSWGKSGRVVPPFRCVITSMTVKYTMFSREGLPLRATVSLALSEAGIVDLMAANDSGYRTSTIRDTARALAAFDVESPIAAIAARISAGVKVDLRARGLFERAVRRAIG